MEDNKDLEYDLSNTSSEHLYENISEEDVQDTLKEDKLSKGFYDNATIIFNKFFTKRILLCLFLLFSICVFEVFRSAKYQGLVVDVEGLQQCISDINNKEIFVSSKLVEYKNQDLIEAEIKNKQLNLVIAEDIPYFVEDDDK